MSIVEKAMDKLQRRAAAEQRRAAEAPVLPAATAVTHHLVPAANIPAGAGSSPPRHMLHINQIRLRELGVLPPEAEHRRIAAEFRRIKRPLVERVLAATSELGGNPNVIMVASAVPGEGKTFTAFNLAMSLALEKDASVLLIDADVPKPQISVVLGIQAGRGLLDAVIDPALDVESLIHATDIANLSVLGIGTKADNATELLASQRMAALIAELRAADDRRIVVFDSPPLLLTTESRELATLAGQIVLVVRAGETPQQALFDAIALLGEGKLIGLVLNQVDPRDDEAPYYGFGQYGTYGDSVEGGS
jgi:protein-tyrosine kinase